MYYTTSKEEEFLILILTHTKDIFYSIFNQEIEKYSFGENFNYGLEVYNNKDNSFGYNNSIDFKYIVDVLDKGFDLTQLRRSFLNQNNKNLFRSLLKMSRKLRNILWHSKAMSIQQIEKLVTIWNQIFLIIKNTYNDIDNTGQMKLVLSRLEEQIMKTKKIAEENKKMMNIIISEDISSDDNSSNEGNEDNNIGNNSIDNINQKGD